ncbi:MAG: glycosyltransferase family 87 protein [Planctomycetota bacterium]|nr:glycosyltransferase family 87 protein [Planctomycetota bacterium]
MPGASPDKIDLYLWFYPAAVLFLGLAAAAVLGWRVSKRTGLVLAGAGILFGLCNGLRRFNLDHAAVDFERNWMAGRAWLEGVDPYTQSVMNNYPPYALPLFALPASIPFEAASLLMLLVNLVGAAMLVPVAYLALRSLARAGRPAEPLAETEGGGELPIGVLAILSAAVALSLPVYFSVTLGQPTIYIALCAMGALIAQGRGRPVLAGLLLAIAAVKPQTVLPLFLLFLSGRKDILTWLTFTVAVGLSWLFSAPFDQLADRTREMLHNASSLTEPGQINDYTNDSGQVHSLLGIDRLLYCMGLHARPAVRVAQAGLILLGGGWLWLKVVRPGQLSRPAAGAIVVAASMMFLYHRTYDLTILALPLTYAAGLATRTTGRPRLFAIAACLAMLFLFFMHPRLTHVVALRLDHWPVVGTLGHALLMPMFIWLLLATIACLCLANAAQAEDRRPAGPPQNA